MPGGKTLGPSVKNPRQYEALKGQGFSKMSAAKISNAAARKLQDPRSKRAIFTRGKNLYPGGTHTPHKKRKSLQSVSQRTLYRRLRGK